MGFFDFLFDKQKARGRQIEKLKKKLTNRWVQSPDRNYAAEQLFQMNTPESFRALMCRFKMHTQNTTYDVEEKTYVSDMIISAGARAIDVVKEDVLQEPETINWQMRVLEDLLTGQQMSEFIEELLSKMDVDYERDPVKKEQLLVRAGSYMDNESLQKEVARFVVDDNEDIRFQAVSLVVKHDHLWARDALRENVRLEDSGRIIDIVCQRFATMKEWTALEDPEDQERRKEIDDNIPAKYLLNEDGFIRRK